MANILTNEEVAKAIDEEADFDPEELERLAKLATAFIKEKTGRDFGKDSVKHPLAVECARLYLKQLHYSKDGYNKEYDYTFGVVSLIEDLKNIAMWGESNE